MTTNYRTRTPRIALALLAVAATALTGLSVEGLARYTAAHAAQASLPVPQQVALTGQ
jgi:hypothetical protein